MEEEIMKIVPRGKTSEVTEKQSPSESSVYNNSTNINKEESQKFQVSTNMGETKNTKNNKNSNDREYLEEFRKSLPIYQYREELLNVVRDNPFCVITGDTGSGKTTQIPQYIIESLRISQFKKFSENIENNQSQIQSQSVLLENQEKSQNEKADHSKNTDSKSDIPKIVVTQPRRVAAIQMAKRVSYEKNYKLGREVGYSIRFEDYTDDSTILKYVTDGILVKECLADQNLSKYNIIILDEAHERSLYTDILFALCKQAVIRRKGDLRLIVTSATLDTKQFSSYFNDCPVFAIGGKIYPVEMIYFTSRMEKRVENSVKLAIRIHLHEGPGHILSFLTGFEECEQACKMCYQKLEDLAKKGKKVPPMVIMPLYGAQNTDEQAMIFEKVPENCRKLIFSTNIAETSLTVDGIGYVIDCGYVKQKIYNSKTAMDTLCVVPISKVQAIQRAGRAGRTGPGKCIRLYTEQFFETQMSKVTIPEILRVNLASTILTLKSMGIDDVVEFDFMEKPEKESVFDALKELYFLQSIDDNGRITKLGLEMAKFPIECCYARCLIASKYYDVLDEMNTLVSLISCENVWFNVNKYDEERRAFFEQKKSEFIDKFSDHMSFLNIYKEWEFNNYSEDWCKQNFLHFRTLKQAKKIKEQIYEYMNKVNFKECEKYFNLRTINYLKEEIEIDHKNILDDYEKVNCLMRMALCQGFYMNAAKKVSNSVDGCSYLRISDGSVITIDQYSSICVKQLKPELVIYTELGGTNHKAVMKQVSIIELKWISDLLSFIKKVDVFKLRGKIKTPPNNLMSIYNKNLGSNEIDLYSIIESKNKTQSDNNCTLPSENIKGVNLKEDYLNSNFITLEEANYVNEAEELKRKVDEAKERYLQRKTLRK
jgi:ATP-dependent RNA helicase DHX8/PRP22